MHVVAQGSGAYGLGSLHLALRQAEAFSRSVLRLLGLGLTVPDHTTLSRHGQTFA